MLFRKSSAEKRRLFIGIIFYCIMTLLIGYLARDIFHSIQDASAFNPSIRQIPQLIPAFAFFSLFCMLTLSSITTGIQYFYMNPEMGLLLACPLPRKAILFSRYLESSLNNSAVFLLLGVPVIFAYAITFVSINISYFLFCLLVCCIFTLLPSVIGLGLTMLLMRILPANRARDLFGAIGVSLFSSVYVIMSMFARRMDEGSAPDRMPSRMVEMVSSPVFRTGPWGWAGDVIAGHASVVSIFLLAGLTAAACLLYYHMSEALYKEGWLQMRQANSRGSRIHRQRVLISEGIAIPFISSPVYAIIKKDLKSLSRDMLQLSMLFIPLSLTAVYLVNLRLPPQMAGADSSISRYYSILSTFTLCFMMAPITLRLGISSFIGETRAIWLALSAPQEPHYILRGKLIYALLLAMPISMITAFVVVRASGGSMEIMLRTCLFTFYCTSGYCAIAVGGYARIMDFKSVQARAAIPPGGQILLLGIQCLYFILLGLFYLIPMVFFIYFRVDNLLLEIACQLISLLLTAGTMAASTQIGNKRLMDMEW
jgi:hypothetical protein